MARGSCRFDQRFAKKVRDKSTNQSANTEASTTLTIVLPIHACVLVLLRIIFSAGRVRRFWAISVYRFIGEDYEKKAVSALDILRSPNLTGFVCSVVIFWVGERRFLGF